MSFFNIYATRYGGDFSFGKLRRQGDGREIDRLGGGLMARTAVDGDMTCSLEIRSVGTWMRNGACGLSKHLHGWLGKHELEALLGEREKRERFTRFHKLLCASRAYVRYEGKATHRTDRLT